MEELLKQSWQNSESINFSYTQKYLIKYGHHPEVIGGTFSGKLYGYGYMWVDNPFHLSYNNKIQKLFYFIAKKFTPMNFILKLKISPSSVQKFCVQIEEAKKYYAIYLEDISN